MRGGLLGLVLWMGLLGAWEIRGVVKDQEGKSLPWASVEILGLRRGTASDDRGVFWLEIPDTLSRAQLRISYVGFRPETLLVSRGQAWVTVRLVPEVVEVATVTSYAPYRLSAEEVSVDVEAKPIDVYTTPGAAADPLQALKAYTPFTGNPDVAALAIRGGRTDETLVEINGILYPRPYIFSLSTGGLFFSIPVEAVSKLEAYPGTLPASRGFRLAGGVLMDLETRPLSPFFTLSTGGGSFGVPTPVGNFWGQVNSYRLMAKLNGDPVRYSVYPAAYSGTYAKSGVWGPLRWKIFGHGNLSESEGRLMGDRGFRDREFQGVGGIRLEGNPSILTAWSMEIGTTLRQDTLRYMTPKSAIHLHQSNRTYQGRGEWMRWWSERLFSVLGGQVFVRRRQYAGTAIQNGDTTQWRTASRDTLVAVYGSLNLAAAGRGLRGGLGLRLERKTNTPWAQTQVLPRLFVEKPLGNLNLSLNAGGSAQWKDSLWVRGWLVEGSLRGEIFHLTLYGRWFSDHRRMWGAEGSVALPLGELRASWMQGKERNHPLREEVPWRVIYVASGMLRDWVRWGVKIHLAGGSPYEGVGGWKRMPWYRRVDLQLGRGLVWGGLQGYIFFEMYNVLDHPNVTQVIVEGEEEVPVVMIRRLWVAGIAWRW